MRREGARGSAIEGAKDSYCTSGGKKTLERGLGVDGVTFFVLR